MSNHSAVNQTFNEGLAALTKRKEKDHAGLDDKRADLERKQVTVEINRQTFVTDITTQHQTLTTEFEADTAEYNQMNTALVTSKRK